MEDLCELLNATNPKKSLEEYLSVQRWSKGRKNAFRKKFNSILVKAQQDNIPLGVELKNCLNYEDAYVLRQRFLSKIFKQEDSFKTISGILLLMLFGFTFIILTLIFT